MKCGAQKKRLKNRKKDAEERHLHQAPHFFIPTIRIDLRFWKTTEKILRDNLEERLFYPFSLVSPFGMYRLRFTEDLFWYGVAFTTIFMISAVLFMSAAYRLLITTESELQEWRPPALLYKSDLFNYLPFITIFLFLSCWWTFSRFGVNTLYLDCQGLTYELYRGRTLAEKGHFHNIYIKIKSLQVVKNKKKRDKDDKSLHFIILGGFRIPNIFLSSFSKNYKEMRRLGRRIAANFNLNFVDADCVSKHHVIRHRCPYHPFVSKNLDDLDFFEDISLSGGTGTKTTLLGKRTLDSVSRSGRRNTGGKQSVGRDVGKHSQSVGRDVGKHSQSVGRDVGKHSPSGLKTTAVNR